MSKHKHKSTRAKNAAWLTDKIHAPRKSSLKAAKPKNWRREIAQQLELGGK